MSTLKEAAQQALEALDWLQHHLTQHHGCLHMNPSSSGIPAWIKKTEAAVKAALADGDKLSPCEPVAWMDIADDGARLAVRMFSDGSSDEVPLYLGCDHTSQPQRKPLTDEEIEIAYKKIWRDLPDDFAHTAYAWIEQGIRYAEEAHGIKE